MDSVIMSASQNKFFDYEQREAVRKAEQLEQKRRNDYDSEDDSDMSREEEKKSPFNQSQKMANS